MKLEINQILLSEEVGQHLQVEGEILYEDLGNGWAELRVNIVVDGTIAAMVDFVADRTTGSVLIRSCQRALAGPTTVDHKLCEFGSPDASSPFGPSKS